LEGYRGGIYHFGKHGGRFASYLAFLIVTFGCGCKLFVSLIKVTVLRRHVDRENLKVYSKILPQLLRNGINIAAQTKL
jgi:hypothetical protein